MRHSFNLFCLHFGSLIIIITIVIMLSSSWWARYVLDKCCICWSCDTSEKAFTCCSSPVTSMASGNYCFATCHAFLPGRDLPGSSLQKIIFWRKCILKKEVVEKIYRLNKYCKHSSKAWRQQAELLKTCRASVLTACLISGYYTTTDTPLLAFKLITHILIDIRHNRTGNA